MVVEPMQVTWPGAGNEYPAIVHSSLGQSMNRPPT
jgi:hypothetical protein